LPKSFHIQQYISTYTILHNKTRVSGDLQGIGEIKRGRKKLILLSALSSVFINMNAIIPAKSGLEGGAMVGVSGVVVTRLLQQQCLDVKGLAGLWRVTRVVPCTNVKEEQLAEGL
jgi:hypothetical protein